MSDETRTDYGEDVLSAIVKAENIPALKMAALDKARRLWGPDARLEIEGMRDIHSSPFTGSLNFFATVIVRNLDGGAA